MSTVIVSLLREMLIKAERGELMAVGIASTTHDGGSIITGAGALDLQMAGAVACLQNYVLRQITNA